MQLVLKNNFVLDFRKAREIKGGNRIRRITYLNTATSGAGLLIKEKSAVLQLNHVSRYITTIAPAARGDQLGATLLFALCITQFDFQITFYYSCLLVWEMFTHQLDNLSDPN